MSASEPWRTSYRETRVGGDNLGRCSRGMSSIQNRAGTREPAGLLSRSRKNSNARWHSVSVFTDRKALFSSTQNSNILVSCITTHRTSTDPMFGTSLITHKTDYFSSQESLSNADQSERAAQSKTMEDFEYCFRELRESVKGGVRDHSLATSLRKKVEGIRLEPQLVQLYCDGLFKLYDLSNSSTFLTRPPLPQRNEPIILDPLAVSIKTIVLKMLGCLVAFFNDNPGLDMPNDLLYEALEIMVMVSRVLLDLSQSAEVRQVYPLVVTFREAMGEVLPREVELAHWLNLLELYELDVDSRSIDLTEYRRAMHQIESLCSKAPPPQGYLQLAYNFTLEVILKLLKKGANNQAKSLICFLPEKMKTTVLDLVSIEPKFSNEEGSGLRVSPFYELYLQIKNSGISNIAEENLRMFLSKEDHFNDGRLFDVVALTGEVLPLEIWLEIHLNSRGKSDQIQSAYRCFLYLIDQAVDHVDMSPATSLASQCSQQRGRLVPLLRLSKLVMITLLSDKKDSPEPVLNIIKRLSKLLIALVISLHSQPLQIQQFIEKVLLICGKYNLNDIGRSITCIGFYYELIMGVVSEEGYVKFCKANLVDKGSELFRMLKLAYLFRMGKEVSLQEEKGIIRKEPFILLLFANEPHQQLILRLPPPEFATMKQKWEAYLLLLQDQEAPNQGKQSKVVAHMEETLIHSDWSKLSNLDLSYISDLSSYFLNLLKESTQILSSSTKCQLSLLLLYLFTITTIPSKLPVLNGSVLLNRYSKLLKLLSLSKDECKQLQQSQRLKLIEMHLYLAKVFMCSQLQMMKIQQLQGEATMEVGLMVLVDLLNDIVQQNQNNPQICEFFRFVRFQMLCLADSLSETQIACEVNPKLLKLYCSSKYIKKNMKLKIMRRLIREDLISDSKMLSLADLSELIQITEDPKEKGIFASYIIRTFGEEGKTYIMLQSAKDPQGYSFLFDEHNDDE